jgi:hypothetical protein
MAHPRKSRDQVSTNDAVSSVGNDKNTRDDPIDPRAFGLTKVPTSQNLRVSRCFLFLVSEGDAETESRAFFRWGRPSGIGR